MDKPSISVAIPATIKDAVGALNGIDALLTAKGWERAAIVYAFTYDGEEARSEEARSDEKSSLLTISAFANLGIAGLKTRDTVRYYRDNWIAAGDLGIAPGDTVTLPDEDFPIERKDTNFGERVSPEKAREQVGKWSPEAKAAAAKVLAQDEDAQGAIIETISDDHGLTAQVDDAWDRKNPRKQPVKNPGAVVSIMEIDVHTGLCNELVKEGKTIPSALMGVGSVEPGTPIHDVLTLYRSALQRAQKTIDSLEPLVAAMLGDGPKTAEDALAEWSNS